jgi:pimeloyl-ACP methyl ester carboxylesterase
MGAMKPLYKGDVHRKELLRLYAEKLASLDLAYTETFVETPAGRTSVLIAGEAGLPPVVLIHGVTASAPIALEPIKGLARRYRIYAVNCVGAPNPSAETRLSMHDGGYGDWLAAVVDGLGLREPPFIAASYGAFVLQRLIATHPDRIGSIIFVVPAGFANGGLSPTLFKVLLPLMRFYRTRKEPDLIRFMDAFFTRTDAFAVAWQKAALLGLNLDLRKPPVLTEKEAEGFAGPVYMLAAGDDVFFPAPAGIARCRKLFRGFREAVILENAKHVPAQEDFPRIERQAGAWLAAVLQGDRTDA